MPADIHMMGKGKMMDARTSDRVHDCVARTLSHLEARYPVTDLDIVLFPSFNLVHPSWFRTGKCHSANAVEIQFNPRHRLFEDRLEIELPAVVLHEVHHALRYRHFDHWTIGENLVLEGLARCAEGVFGHEPSNYDPPLPNEVLNELCDKGRSEMDITDPERFAWIWQSHNNEHLPNMYHVGKAFVEPALKRMGKDAFSAIDMPYQEFISPQSAVT